MSLCTQVFQTGNTAFHSALIQSLCIHCFCCLILNVTYSCSAFFFWGQCSKRMYQWFIQWHYHILKYNFWSYSTLWHFWLPLHIELIFFIKLPEVTASLLMALVNLGVSNICYRFTLFFLLGICQNWISSTAMLSIHQVVMFLYFLSALVGLNWYVSLVLACCARVNFTLYELMHPVTLIRDVPCIS